MDQQQQLTPYEVYCHACRVTFAAGTKKCLHCGGRLGGRGGARTFKRAAPSSTQEPLPPEMVIEEEPSLRSRLPVSPVTLLWLVVIAGSFAQRACDSG